MTDEAQLTPEPWLTASRIHVLIGALFGACGVAAMAGGTHGGAGNLTLAGTMLLFHAPAILAVTALRRAEFLPMRAGATALSLLILGVALFSGDLACRALAGAALFPMAAPLGGVALIAGWLAIGLAAMWRVRPPQG